ncbi:thymidylate kinase [Atractiella rhizophila]|nr:thymidylate kinase [Atractiella rhizophila]
MIIVFEGLDRSGKSSQSELLKARLEEEGKTVQLLKFPDRTTPIGTLINSYLLSKSNLSDESIHLLFSANRWEKAESIQETLSAGTWIVADRYCFSGIAFTAAKGLSIEWCRSPDVGLPAPDLTLFLDLTAEAAEQRGGYGEERYEKKEMQRKVKEHFEALGKEEGERWKVIDADGTREEVKGKIWDAVRYLMDVDGGIEIRKMWQ